MVNSSRSGETVAREAALAIAMALTPVVLRFGGPRRKFGSHPEARRPSRAQTFDRQDF
jgi:hypothetical protein